MKIHEYQAKELFRKYHVPVPEGRVAFAVADACKAAEEIGRFPVAVKAQIHAGGRGKGGGIKLTASIEEVRQAAGDMLGKTLHTRQTGPEGKKVRKVLVEAGADDIQREIYVAFTIDRPSARIAVITSEAGGMDIEEAAAASPEKLNKIFINPLTGMEPRHAEAVVSGLQLRPKARQRLGKILTRLYTLFAECDCTLVEINPLAVTAADEVVALDAKVEVDSSALFRQQDILAYRDVDEEDPLEVEASKFHLNYIHLEGNVASLVNGAGLAMATMDLIKRAGAEPANFLDVGGGASAEMIENGFRIMLRDKKVKLLLINIFGGILRCDVLAEGVVRAAAQTGTTLPVVVRMEGTNAEQGREILAASNRHLITATDLQDASHKIARLAKSPAP